MRRYITWRGMWWLISKFVAFCLKGHEFESSSIRHVETLHKFFTRSCLWSFGVKLRHSIVVYAHYHHHQQQQHHHHHDYHHHCRSNKKQGPSEHYVRVGVPYNAEIVMLFAFSWNQLGYGK